MPIQNLWPEQLPRFRAAVSDYWRAMERLSAKLMRIFALALDLNEDFFLIRSDRHVTNMRLNYYPTQHRPPEPGQLRAGAHSDYGAFTVLKGENAPGGLEVLRRGGDWTPVPMIDDGFVINIGDLLMRWTNDRWVSTIHRVVNPPEAACREVDRMSVAFFFTPNHDVEVSCLDSCMDAQRPARYAPVTAGAHWRARSWRLGRSQNRSETRWSRRAYPKSKFRWRWLQCRRSSLGLIKGCA